MSRKALRFFAGGLFIACSGSTAFAESCVASNGRMALTCQQAHENSNSQQRRKRAVKDEDASDARTFSRPAPRRAGSEEPMLAAHNSGSAGEPGSGYDGVQSPSSYSSSYHSDNMTRSVDSNGPAYSVRNLSSEVGAGSGGGSTGNGATMQAALTNPGRGPGSSSTESAGGRSVGGATSPTPSTSLNSQPANYSTKSAPLPAAGAAALGVQTPSTTSTTNPTRAVPQHLLARKPTGTPTPSLSGGNSSTSLSTSSKSKAAIINSIGKPSSSTLKPVTTSVSNKVAVKPTAVTLAKAPTVTQALKTTVAPTVRAPTVTVRSR